MSRITSLRSHKTLAGVYIRIHKIKTAQQHHNSKSTIERWVQQLVTARERFREKKKHFHYCKWFLALRLTEYRIVRHVRTHTRWYVCVCIKKSFSFHVKLVCFSFALRWTFYLWWLFSKWFYAILSSCIHIFVI